jgi:6-phosphogluconolactonase (cycloisomerase 2 family)
MKQVIALGSATAFLLAAACGSSRRADSFAYVGNNDLSSISVFHVDPGTGMLTLLKTVEAAAGGATYCEFHPSGRFMFVSGQFGSVLSTYSIDASGTPALVAGSTVTTGLNPHNLSLDPAGRFVYVANTSSNTVSGFAVATNGTLTPIARSPFASGLTPYAVKVADSGKFAYTANRDSDDISAYAIDSATGALTAIAGQPFRVGCAASPCGPRAIEFSPNGAFAFVPNRFSNDVSVLAVNTVTGAMVPVAGSPFAAGTDPRSLALDPSGRYLYVPNVASNDVSAFSVDTKTGALTQLTGSPYPVGSGPLSVEVDDSGRFVYVANSASNNVSIYKIDAAAGHLTTVGTVATAGSAFSIALK